MTKQNSQPAALAAQPHIGIPAIFLVKPEPPPCLGGVCIGGVGSAIRRTLHSAPRLDNLRLVHLPLSTLTSDIRGMDNDVRRPPCRYGHVVICKASYLR